MTTIPQPKPGPAGTRRHALLVVGGIAAVALLLPVGLTVVLFGVDEPVPSPARERPATPDPGIASVPQQAGDPAWDLAAQAELANRPMMRLPEAAALPHPLTDATAGPPFTLPPASGTIGVLPSGYPGTVEGAIAQLAALTRIGLEGGDPEGYRLAYESITMPGSAPVEQARLYRDLQRVRSRVAGFPPTGAVAGLVFSWTPTSALVKGTTDGGRYAVVCVLGELVAGINGQSIASGAGDCQALRRVGDQWWISPGAAAAPATLAWPGTEEAMRAGYRGVRS